MRAAPGRLYFDHAATTPVRPEVLAAMLPHLGEHGFNASSTHAEGRAARAALDEARGTIARLLGAKSREIVFTSGGSESDTLAIVGGARAARRERGGAHVVTAATEHVAVLAAMAVLRDSGFAVTVLGVDREGRVAAGDFARALRPDTVFASLMLANNELGTIHPIADMASLARGRGVVFHTDAVQAAGRMPLDVDALGVDLLTLSAHKCYGPKGVGLLYVRGGSALVPLVVGGPQEAGRRAGTENVAGIVGFARALALATAERPIESYRLATLRDRLEAGIVATIPGVHVNASGATRLANVASVAFDGVDATALTIALDLAGVAVSAGSACAAGSVEPSHVLEALALPYAVGAGTIRFSLGKLSQEQDVERLLQLLRPIIAVARVGDSNVGTALSGSSLGDRSEVRS